MGGIYQTAGGGDAQEIIYQSRLANVAEFNIQPAVAITTKVVNVCSDRKVAENIMHYRLY